MILYLIVSVPMLNVHCRYNVHLCIKYIHNDDDDDSNERGSGVLL